MDAKKLKKLMRKMFKKYYISEEEQKKHLFGQLSQEDILEIRKRNMRLNAALRRRRY